MILFTVRRQRGQPGELPEPPVQGEVAATSALLCNMRDSESVLYGKAQRNFGKGETLPTILRKYGSAV